jgi:hypothetical protein
MHAVLADVEAGLVSSTAASTIYGVVIDQATIDIVATEALRKQLLSARVGGAIPDKMPTGRPIPLSYDHAGSATSVACANCDQVLALSGEAWKAKLLPIDSPMNEIIAAYTTIDGLMLRQYACPSCGSLLDSETVYEDDPPLLDIIGAIPDA